MNLSEFSEALTKALRWFFSAAALIWGICFLRMSTDKESIAPVIMCILLFGFVFWTSKITYEASRRILIYTVGALVGLGLTARFTRWLTADLITMGTSRFDTGFYMWWMILVFLVGVPVMLYAFKTEK